MASGLAGTQVLSSQMRQALSNLSNRLFYQEPSRYENFQSHLPGNENLTSLPLQMSMYFNAFFFPFWLITYCIMLEVKYQYLTDTYKVILIAIVVLFTAIEVARLYLGYIGNLQEKVPEIAGFLLLTVMLQLPSIIFLLVNPSVILLPMEGVTDVVMGLMILIEIISGYFATSAMTRQQATKFRLQQFIDLDNLNQQPEPIFDEIGRHDVLAE